MTTTNPETNLRGLDYRAEAARLGTPAAPIIDVHAHINGLLAPRVYAEAREAFGVTRTYSMTNLEFADPVRAALGDSVRFIAMPRFGAADVEERRHAFTQGFLDDLKTWHGLGCRMCKLWTAPRGRDIGRALGDPTLLTFGGEWRLRHMDRAAELGMMFMAHVGDPDTWFRTKYGDAGVYGTKASHYETVERALEAYRVPWVLAHMGGWPEDLGFLAGLLERHTNVYLDTSATKWMVRELGKHPLGAVRGFVERFRDRLLFGSDIVTLDDHLGSTKVSNLGGGEKGRQASSEAEAFDLYAGRYLALRTMWETGYDGPCFFADGDLHMVEPGRYSVTDAARLVGQSLPEGLLRGLYHDNAVRLLDGWWARG